jgi:transcriptional regulator with XRE-family HTH domain
LSVEGETEMFLFDSARGDADPGAASTGAARLRRAIAGVDECRYGVHIDFEAPDDAAARGVAVEVAEALGILRPEVETYSAWLSLGAVDSEQVFCMADGPRGAFCGLPFRHHGTHAEPGVKGLRWDDAPSVRQPDTRRAGVGGFPLRELTPHVSPRHFLGAEVRRWRLLRNLSLDELAGMVYQSAALLGRVEKAERRASAALIADCDEVLNTGGALGRVLAFAENFTPVARPERQQHASVLIHLITASDAGEDAVRPVRPVFRRSGRRVFRMVDVRQRRRV